MTGRLNVTYNTLHGFSLRLGLRGRAVVFIPIHLSRRHGVSHGACIHCCGGGGRSAKFQVHTPSTMIWAWAITAGEKAWAGLFIL